MKKIFILAYIRKNLGDDLFVSTLLKKYKNEDVMFYIHINNEKFIADFEKYDNLIILNGKEGIFDKDIKYDAYVYIAGSIFMEKDNSIEFVKELKKYVKECNKKEKPFFFISTNFGPYNTEEFYNTVYETLENCHSICFRDKYSYEKFKNLKTVNYAPDAILSMDKKNPIILKNTLGINVISPDKCTNFLERENYFICLKNNIEQYILSGMKVYLYSFCDDEGDSEAINELVSLIDYKYLSEIFVVKYDGNADDFINLYGKMEYMLCSRFHGMILSSLYGAKINVLSYSKKLNNVIEDLNFEINYMNLNELQQEDILSLDKYTYVKQNSLKKAIRNSKSQFKKLDEVIYEVQEVEKEGIIDNMVDVWENGINNAIVDSSSIVNSI